MDNPSPGQVREVLRAVLSQDQFRPAKPNSEWLVPFLHWLDGHAVHAPGWLMAVLLALVTGLLVLVLYRSGTRYWNGAVPPTRVGASTLVVLEGEASTPQQALRLAREAADRGDFRQALWISHRLVLLALDGRGALRFRPAKTNQAYLRECPPQRPEFRLLSDLTAHYEEVVYAQRPARSQETLSLLAKVEELWQTSRA